MPDQIDRILRINTVLDRIGLSRATLYRKIADGSFPAQQRLSARCVGWRKSEVLRRIYNPYGYVAANDNGAPPIASAKVSAALKRIARLIGQQIAREAFEQRSAANDNSICVLRYDNEAGKGDHRHIGTTETPYAFTTAGALLADFWKDVDQWTPE